MIANLQSTVTAIRPPTQHRTFLNETPHHTSVAKEI